MHLEDRVAIVTGGSAGIGREISMELAHVGAKVVVKDIQEQPNIGKFHETEVQTPTAASIAAGGGEALFVATDVADEKAVQNLAARAVECFGGLDIFVNLTRDSAVELAADNITVNSICPGYVETPIQDYLSQEIIEECKKLRPLPRLGVPRNIGRTAVFFASDDAAWITGVAGLIW